MRKQPEPIEKSIGEINEAGRPFARLLCGKKIAGLHTKKIAALRSSQLSPFRRYPTFKLHYVLTNPFRESQLAHQLVSYRHLVSLAHSGARLYLVFRDRLVPDRTLLCNVLRVRIFYNTRLSSTLFAPHFPGPPRRAAAHVDLRRWRL